MSETIATVTPITKKVKPKKTKAKVFKKAPTKKAAPRGKGKQNRLLVTKQPRKDIEVRNEPTRAFSNILFNYRSKKGLTLLDMAKVLKVDAGYVSRLERGLIEPKLSTALHFMKLVGASVSQLEPAFKAVG